MNREEIIKELEASPANVKFSRLCNFCDFFFGKPRQSGTSHRVYKMPWQGDPRVNIQKKGNKAKAYQVKQVIQALKKLE
jgi:hypothetical protein